MAPDPIPQDDAIRRTYLERAVRLREKMREFPVRERQRLEQQEARKVRRAHRS
jgi:hypothetical protein